MSYFQKTSAARGKVLKRQKEYKDSFSPNGTDYYKPKTRRNAWVKVTAGGITLPLQNNTYDTLYANNEGKPDVILDSVKITEGSDFGMLRTVDVAFTCLRRSTFESLEKAMLRPSTEVKIQVGYADTSDSMTLTDFVICKYNFSLDENNNYACGFRAYGPGPFMNEVEIDVQGKFTGLKIVSGGFFKKPVTTIAQYLKYVAQGNGLLANVDIDNWTTRANGHIVIIDNPNSITPDGMVMRLVYKALQALGLITGDASKKIYCTLEWFIETLQKYVIAPRLANKMSGRKLICNGSVSTGRHAIPSIGSAYPMNIVLPGGTAGSAGGPGYYGSSGNVNDSETKLDFSSNAKACLKGSTADYSKILISYDYIQSTLFGSAKDKGAVKKSDKSTSDSGTKSTRPKQTLQNLLDQLFSDISAATGGLVQLKTMEDPDNSKEQHIVSKSGDGAGIRETMFDPINGDGITRKCSVKCDIPANDAYAVANGGTTAGSGQTAEELAEEVAKKAKARNEANQAKADAYATIKDLMQEGLSYDDFESETCDALAAAFKTLVEFRSKSETEKGPIDDHIWPLQLDIEVDGTSGFRFGDVVNSKFLPGKYRKGGVSVSFVTLEATHTIKGNDWTTSLKTQCHLLSK